MNFDFPPPTTAPKNEPANSGLSGGLIPISNEPKTTKLDLDFDDFDDILDLPSDNDDKKLSKKNSAGTKLLTRFQKSIIY